MSFRLTPEVRAKLEAEAAARGLSLTAALELAVEGLAMEPGGGSAD